MYGGRFVSNREMLVQPKDLDITLMELMLPQVVGTGIGDANLYLQMGSGTFHLPG